MVAIESESFIYGVGRVIVSGAKVEYNLWTLIQCVMQRNASSEEIEEATKGQFTEVAKRFRRIAPNYLSQHPFLIERINQIIGEAQPPMRRRGRLAHSPFLLDPVASHKADFALHTGSGEITEFQQGELDDLADHLDLLAVKISSLAADIMAATGRQSVEAPADLGEVIITRVSN